MADRVIFHCDCNNFFASVELLDHPELREKAVAVAGSVDDRRGIILAKNEVAKKYNIKTAETVWQAKQKYPALILLPPHHSQYRKFSKILNDIYGDYTDQVESFGIDESWLDVSGSWSLFGPSPSAVADALRSRVKAETGLTISIGVSFNKVFSKLGSDYKKPDATTVITRNDVPLLLYPLPVSAMLYVGKRSKEMLEKLGIDTIGKLAAADRDLLENLLGKQGRMLSRYARGEDDSPVSRIGEMEPVKSVGNGLTFKRNLLGHSDVRTAIGALADEVAGRLRAKKLYAGALQVTIKNPELKSISRQGPLPFATNLAKDLTAAAMALMQEHWDYRKPIRMLTVTTINLSDIPYATQTSFLEKPLQLDKKRLNLEESLDKIREKYGRSSIFDASVLNNDIGLTTKQEQSNANEFNENNDE